MVKCDACNEEALEGELRKVTKVVKFENDDGIMEIAFKKEWHICGKCLKIWERRFKSDTRYHV